MKYYVQINVIESDECSEPFQWILSPFDEFSLQDVAIAASSWAAKKHLHHMNTSCHRIQERDLVISCLFKPYFFWTVRMKHTKEFCKKKKLHLIRFKNNSFQVQDAQCNLAPRRPSEEIQRKIQRSSNRPVKGSKMIQKIQAKSSHLSTHTKSWQIGRLTTLQSCGNGCDAHQVR